MKKLLVLFVITVICISSFAGCEAEKRSTWRDSGFTFIESKGNMDYIYHDETKVIYVFIRDCYQAGLTTLLNPDGTPMLWED